MHRDLVNPGTSDVDIMMLGRLLGSAPPVVHGCIAGRFVSPESRMDLATSSAPNRDRLQELQTSCSAHRIGRQAFALQAAAKGSCRAFLLTFSSHHKYCRLGSSDQRM